VKLSASALKEFTTCGYKFKLQRVDGLTEPGAKSFGALHGNIMHDAMAEGSLWLNKNQDITDADIGSILTAAFEKNFEESYIPKDLLPYIRKFCVEGNDPDLPMLLHTLAPSINSHVLGGEPTYNLRIPDLLKSGALPNNSKKPTMDQILDRMMIGLNWFFTDTLQAEAIKAAVHLDHERYIESPMSREDIEKYLCGHPFNDEILLNGYLDQVVQLPDGTEIVSEWKTDKTAYSESFLTRMVQAITYRLMLPDPKIMLFDVTHQRWFDVVVTTDMLELTKKRYVDLAKATMYDVYIPACGTDPYTDGRILCGFKCGGCPFSDSTIMEDAA